MATTPRSPRTASRRTPSTPSTPAPAAPVPTLPPQVAAIAAMFDATGEWRIGADFLEAWRTMPALLAQLLSGNGSANHGITRWTLGRQRLEESIAQGEASDFEYQRDNAKAIRMLNELHPDALSEIETACGDAAFWTGLAAALYVLTVGTPLPIGNAEKGNE